MPARAFARRLTFSYLLPLIAMIVLAAVVTWRELAQQSTTRWVLHTDDVILRAKDAELELLAMQLNFRSYLLSSNRRYQRGLRDADGELAATLEQIATLVHDNPVQEQRLRQINDSKTTMLNSVAKVIAAGGPGADSEAVNQVENSAVAILKTLDEMVEHEYSLLARRTAEKERGEELILVLVPVLSLGVAVFLVLWGWNQIGQAQRSFAKALAASDESIRLRENFVNTVIHELRNPLNTIILSSEVLPAENSHDDESRAAIQTIRRSAQVLSQLIEDLLDLSRIERGRLQLEVRPVDLVQTIHAALEPMRIAAAGKSIEIEEILDPNGATVAGDAIRLQQVIWNLVSNAVKFTPEGGKVQVRLERKSVNAEISVIDNGVGIEESALLHLFDPVWESNDLAPARQRSGLGLTIVRRIVNLHGGMVSVSSDGLGKGSTFTVRLPLSTGTVSSVELRRHPTLTPAASATLSRLDGLSILVIDDDPDAKDLLKLLLLKQGAKVTAVGSAQMALDVLEDLQPNVILSDIGMPGRDGFFLAKEVRKREKAAGAPKVPLVAITAYSRVEDKVNILEAGFDSHVVKPFDAAELSATIRHLVAAGSSKTDAQI